MLTVLGKSTFALALVVCCLGFLVIGFEISGAQHESQQAGLVPPHGTRVTGAVDLIMDGKPQVKSGIEVLAIARVTKFNEAGGCEKKYGDGSCSIRYVPREALPNATRAALAEGLLLYKFTIEGKPPEHISLTPGTYYFFIQYINGRWVGVAVDEKGLARCSMFGLIVREVFSAHPGDDHQPDSRIMMHKIASSEELARLGARLHAAADDWADVQIDWEAFGAGCWKTIVCVPGPSQ